MTVPIPATANKRAVANINQYFGFSARQLRALWWTLALGLISTIYLVVREFSSEVASADGLTIYVGGKDRTFNPMIMLNDVYNRAPEPVTRTFIPK